MLLTRSGTHVVMVLRCRQMWECEGDNIWGVAVLAFLAMATVAVLVYFFQSQVVIPNR